jgi:hypothetical protein
MSPDSYRDPSSAVQWSAKKYIILLRNEAWVCAMVPVHVFYYVCNKRKCELSNGW